MGLNLKDFSIIFKISNIEDSEIWELVLVRHKKESQNTASLLYFSFENYRNWYLRVHI